VGQRTFGATESGAEASLLTIAHPSGIRAAVTNLGATLVSVEVPDAAGTMGEVVLGWPRTVDYSAHANCYLGSTVGRFGNRIARGKFSLDGQSFQLCTNNTPGGIACHLHGGDGGFHRRLWTIEEVRADAVRFRYFSAEGEEGYPGNLTATVTYRVGPGRELTWTAEAVTDATTIVNLVHHPYWNLSGGTVTTIDHHVLQLFAAAFLPVTEGLIPTGEVRSVDRTLMDFRRPHAVAGRTGAGGYDHCWVLDRPADGKAMILAARLSEPESGRVLEVSTNQPGIQFYDGKHLDVSALGHTGIAYGARAGLCLEPQNFPDAPNQTGFPSCRLGPSEVYTSRVNYKFPLP
jgi:aldose 1-epimerase